MCVLLCDVRLEWPVRAVSFSYDGKLLASASEDLFIDIADVETGELLKLQRELLKALGQLYKL